MKVESALVIDKEFDHIQNENRDSLENTVVAEEESPDVDLVVESAKVLDKEITNKEKEVKELKPVLPAIGTGTVYMLQLPLRKQILMSMPYIVLLEQKNIASTNLGPVKSYCLQCATHQHLLQLIY